MNTLGAFLTSTGGFRFTNSWPSEPAVTLRTPFGVIDVGNARSGLCGGMVFAALDYWYAHQVPPVDQPASGTPLYGFLVRRIVDSWNIPVGVAQYFTWMNLPDADTGFDVLGRHVTVDRGVSGRTVLQQWPQVKHDLDQGVPSPLGIVTLLSVTSLMVPATRRLLSPAQTAGYALPDQRAMDWRRWYASRTRGSERR